jgi:hypothetical protein
MPLRWRRLNGLALARLTIDGDGSVVQTDAKMCRPTREEGPVRDVPVIAIVDDDESFRRALEVGGKSIRTTQTRDISCPIVCSAGPLRRVESRRRGG